MVPQLHGLRLELLGMGSSGKTQVVGQFRTIVCCLKYENIMEDFPQLKMFAFK